MAGTKTFIGGLTVGAGLAYFLDPEWGRRRRERFARTVAPLLEEARRTLESGAAGSGGTGLLHYGSRIGDLQGLGAATLSPARFRSPTTAVPTALRALGGALALYGLTRRGTLGAMLRTLGTGMLVGAAGRTAISGSPVPALDRRRAVDIQKTLYIEAPLDQVY